MNFLDVVVIARRFLRDPEADIWDAEQLCLYYNEAQIEIAQKTGYLTRARTLRYPSQVAASYQWDWEYGSTEGVRLPVTQTMKVLQQTSNGLGILYLWEAAYNASTIDATDENYRNTQWWEAAYVITAEPPRVNLSDNIESVRYAAFDQETITGSEERVLAQDDPYYKSAKGQAAYYYFPDLYHNEMVLYPVPPITFDETDILPGAGLMPDDTSLYADKAYTHLWESTDSHAGTDDYAFGHYDTTISKTVLFAWEYDQLAGHDAYNADPDTYKFMYYFEYPATTGPLPGFTTGTEDEEETSSGTALGVDGQLFLVYDYLPAPIEEYTDTITDWPRYFMKYLIAGMLERAFGADTDGFIPSLRDYWKSRKDIGIRAITMFRQQQRRDRDYRLGGTRSYDDRRYPRLPHWNHVTST